MNIAQSFVDLFPFLEGKLLCSCLENLTHGWFRVAIKPNNPALRIESRVGGANFIKFFVSMIETDCNYDITLDALNKRLIQVFSKIF